jgi:hypothetical protein
VVNTSSGDASTMVLLINLLPTNQTPSQKMMAKNLLIYFFIVLSDFILFIILPIWLLSLLLSYKSIHQRFVIDPYIMAYGI